MNKIAVKIIVRTTMSSLIVLLLSDRFEAGSGASRCLNIEKYDTSDYASGNKFIT